MAKTMDTNIYNRTILCLKCKTPLVCYHNKNTVFDGLEVECKECKSLYILSFLNEYVFNSKAHDEVHVSIIRVN